MGRLLLREIVTNLEQFGVEDVTYVPDNIAVEDVDPETIVVTQQFDSMNPALRPEGTQYFLEISVMREVIEGLEAQLGRTASVREKVKAIRHYAKHDAYIDLAQLEEN